MPRHRFIRSDAYPDIWTAVYRLYDAADRLLYVGVAYDFDKRFKDHAKSKAWWPDVVRKDVVWFDNRLDAMWEESRAIDNENPVHNDHPGLGRLGLILVRTRSRFGYDVCPARPSLATSKYDQGKLVEKVGDDRAHVAVSVEDSVVAMLLPWEWYVRACAAMGEPLPVVPA